MRDRHSRRSKEKRNSKLERCIPCHSSKLNPHEFIGGFACLAIGCVHGEADKRSGLGRPKRTKNLRFAAAGSDRSTASNCSTEAKPDPSPMLSVY